LTILPSNSSGFNSSSCVAKLQVAASKSIVFGWLINNFNDFGPLSLGALT